MFGVRFRLSEAAPTPKSYASVHRAGYPWDGAGAMPEPGAGVARAAKTEQASFPIGFVQPMACPLLSGRAAGAGYKEIVYGLFLK